MTEPASAQDLAAGEWLKRSTAHDRQSYLVIKRPPTALYGDANAVDEYLLPTWLIDAIIADHNAASARDIAVRALTQIADADWRIVSGSIGPLMDVGYATAGKVASEKARQALAEIAAIKDGGS